MTVWFTSDTHFGHTKVIEYCNRPFETVEEMDAELVRRWNDCVQPGDEVWHLGDFAFRGRQYQEALIPQLAGNVHLVLGNHDARMAAGVKKMFASVHDYREIDLEGRKVVLSHFPFERWNKMHYGSWHLHGHCHGTLKREVPGRTDVGVDVQGFAPISAESVAHVLGS